MLNRPEWRNYNFNEPLIETIKRARKSCEERDERKKQQKIEHDLKAVSEEEKWTEDDFDVRFRNGKTESYNKHTGKILYTYPNCEQFTVTEAWQDIRDEFRGS